MSIKATSQLPVLGRGESFTLTKHRRALAGFIRRRLRLGPVGHEPSQAVILGRSRTNPS